VITNDGFVVINEGREGKAGLGPYTAAALRSGITGMIAMPNESVRRFDTASPDSTELVPYPVASLDRVLAMQAAISHEALIPTAIYMGLDPETAYSDTARTKLDLEYLHSEFEKVQGECQALKLYLAETTGGYNIAVDHAAEVVETWNYHNPDKLTVLHVEGADVATVLAQIRKRGGQDIPLHIAHVSSRQELAAVITAKKQGMNVTCEVTPHHLFLNEKARAEIGGYGCMKPSLKPQEDVNFLWQNLPYIDIFASDCAPHRRSDKEAEPAAFGVTNHTLMLPLLFGAVREGSLTMETLYQKFCLAPRKRFNLPLDDSSSIHVSTALTWPAAHYNHASYGYEPFSRLNQRFRFVGEIVLSRAGQSEYSRSHPTEHMHSSYSHLIRPKNLEQSE
jgi:dihydroorotase-like cyclic amidohydrolase